MWKRTAGRRVLSGILEKALLRQGTCDTETDDSDMVTLENAPCRRPKNGYSSPMYEIFTHTHLLQNRDAALMPITDKWISKMYTQ